MSPCQRFSWPTSWQCVAGIRGKVTVIPRILFCCVPLCLLLSPFVLLCPPQFSVPLVLFSVPLHLGLSSLRQSHQVSWFFVAVLTGSPSYCSKPVHIQQDLRGILGGFVLRTLLRTKAGFNWGVFKRTCLGTQGPIPVGKLSRERACPLSPQSTSWAQKEDFSTQSLVPRVTGAQPTVCRAQNTLSCVFFFSRKGSFQTFGKEVCITGHSVRTCPQSPVPPVGEGGDEGPGCGPCRSMCLFGSLCSHIFV